MLNKHKPSVLQLGGYLFCFHNCMVGPFMFFADYLRFIEGHEDDRLSDNDLKKRFLRDKDEIRMARPELYKQLKLLLMHTLILIWSLSNIKPEQLVQDEFDRKAFWQKYLIMSITCFASRQVFYFAWTLSAVANLCAGFGFSGFDADGKPEYRFATNIDLIKIELGTSTKTMLDGWNTATSRWLRECVYDRVPKRFGVWAVFVSSAIWHGFYPIYYLTFISAALVTICGRTCRRYIRPYFIGSRKMHFIYDILTHVCAMFCVNYVFVGFLLRTAGNVVHFWRQMRFIGHIVPLALIICLPRLCGKLACEMKLSSRNKAPVQANKSRVVNGAIVGNHYEHTHTSQTAAHMQHEF